MTADTHLPFWDRYLTDPLFAERVDEEARTIPETMAWEIDPWNPVAPRQPCESCGTLLSMIPERTRGGAWKPGAWEGTPAEGRHYLDAPWTRHTARRCAWRRDHPEAAAR